MNLSFLTTALASLLVVATHAVDFVYVTTEIEGVQVIDTSINGTRGSGIATGQNPKGIAVLLRTVGSIPAFSSAYVALPDENAVDVLDITANRTAIGKIAVGSEPTQVATTKELDFIFVSNSGEGTISVIDVGSGEVTLTLTLSGASPRPTNLAISPNTTEVFVIDEGNNGFQIIDLGDLSVTFITVSANANDLAISPDGKTAYITSFSNDELLEFNIASQTFTNAIPIPKAGPLELFPDGKVAYVGGGDTLFLVDLVNTTTLATIGGFTNINDIKISQNFPMQGVDDEGFAYVIDDNANVRVVDIITDSITGFIGMPFPQFLAVAPIPSFPMLEATSGQDQNLTQNDLFHRLRWDPLPGTNPSCHLVFTGEDLTEPLATLPGTAREFINHNREKGIPTNYLIQALEGITPVANGTGTVTCD